jgi:hypothetical protein
MNSYLVSPFLGFESLLGSLRLTMTLHKTLAKSHDDSSQDSLAKIRERFANFLLKGDHQVSCRVSTGRLEFRLRLDVATY